VINNVLRDRVLPMFGRGNVRFKALALGGATAVLAAVSVPAIAAATAEDVEMSGATAAIAALPAEGADTKFSVPKPGTPKSAVKKPAVKAAAKKASRNAARKAPMPAWKQLHPYKIPAGQQTFTPSAEQIRNAKAIVDAGKEMRLPPRAWVIAVSTSLQESTLHNYGHLGARNDHDSQGLFQQRPSSGWGTPKQITNPKYAAKSFYKGLLQVPNWKKRSVTSAAQEVQVSAFPNHYAKWERQAGSIIKSLYGAGPYAKQARQAL
jgi:hypothetical protein